MYKSLTKFRHWRIGQRFKRNGVEIGTLFDLKLIENGVYAVILRPGERRFYRLADHPKATEV